jgi:phosphoglycolate phosphatase-like HAD superfamily hydrolase
MLRAGCERLGTAPPETLYVGDMPLDVESAQRAGLPGLLVPTGAAGADELSRLPGATVARDLLDVAARVKIPAARHSGLDRTGERG